MVVGTVRDKSVVEGHKSLSKLLGVGHDLLGVVNELRTGNLLQTSGDSGNLHKISFARERPSSNLVFMGTTLVGREDGKIDSLFVLLLEEDKSRAGATESLVGGGGYNIAELEGVVHDLGSNKTRNVGHITKKNSLVGVSNSAETSVVPFTRVSGATTNDELGMVKSSIARELLIINVASILDD